MALAMQQSVTTGCVAQGVFGVRQILVDRKAPAINPAA
jgi:hypothetical protein